MINCGKKQFENAYRKRLEDYMANAGEYEFVFFKNDSGLSVIIPMRISSCISGKMLIRRNTITVV